MENEWRDGQNTGEGCRHGRAMVVCTVGNVGIAGKEKVVDVCIGIDGYGGMAIAEAP